MEGVCRLELWQRICNFYVPAGSHINPCVPGLRTTVLEYVVTESPPIQIIQLIRHGIDSMPFGAPGSQLDMSYHSLLHCLIV